MTTTAKPQPAAAPNSTTSQGGTDQTISIRNATRPSPKSADPCTDPIQIGLNRAASSTPTTAAFTPRIAARTVGHVRSVSQNGNNPPTRRKDGKKIATVAINAPSQPFGP